MTEATEEALHRMIVSSFDGMRSDMAAIRADIAGIRAEIGDVRDEIGDVRRDGGERGRRIWEQMNAHGEVLSSLDGRMKVVEKDLTEAKPTFAAYSQLKLRAEGAGWLGRRLWWLGSAIIGAVCWAYASWDKIVAWVKLAATRV